LRADQVARPCTLPNGAERLEVYGLDGRLHRVEEPDGSLLDFSYAMNGTLRLVEHSSGERVEYAHPTDRKILRTANAHGETVIEFDDNGFPERLVQRVDGFEWTIKYERDDVGRVGACLYPQAVDWLRIVARETGKGVCSNFSCGTQSYFDIAMNTDGMGIAFADGTSSEQTVGRLQVKDARGALIADSVLAVDDKGRLQRSGDAAFQYDDAGRLSAFTRPDGANQYSYDDQGRLTEVHTGQRRTVLHYADQITPTRIDGEIVRYDAMGRRSSCGATRYRYNLYGQLAEVILPGGQAVRYFYDGFGRLVGREYGGERVYYIVDFDGHRVAEANAQGEVQRSYLWLGGACVAAVDGVIGAPLAQSFHRGASSGLAAIGLPDGSLQLVDWRDPYGADQLDDAQVPGIASLFPDPATRLYHAGSRWFDPRTAQFLTPDGWFGTDCWNHMPAGVRGVFDRLPGGTNVVETPQAAYVWCHYDPINFADPNGHSAGEGFGMFFSVISFFLWGMQMTSLALQMAAINFVLMIVPSIIDLIVSAAKDKPLWGVNIFNAIAPFVASSRLMVPAAFPLNSLYNLAGSVFTMGSVIWMRGSQQDSLADTSKRDILHCANAADYEAFKTSVASDVFAVPRLAIKGTGTMNAAGDMITAPVLDPALGGGNVGDFFSFGDPIGVRIGAAGRAEFTEILGGIGGIVLTRPLPAAFKSVPAAPVAVEFFRLDQPLVKVEKDGQTVARAITFVRGNSIHFQNQFPEAFPASGLKATEYLLKAKRQSTNFDANKEFLLIQFPSGAAINSYSPGDFLRIVSGSRYFGRKVERKHASSNIVLDVKLGPGAPPLDPKVEVAVMAATADAPVNNQTAVADKVTVGAIRTLRKHDGLLITFAGPPAVIERRIVLQTFLRCALDSALPAALQGKPVKLDLLLADVTKANGKLTAADTVTTNKDEAKRFQKDQPVRITTAPNKEFSTTIKLVTAATETIQLTDNPPAADFPVNTAVTVVLLKPFKTLDGEAGAAPAAGADQTIDVQSDDLAVPVADEPMLVRPATGNDPPVLRKVKGDPAVVAKVDSAPTNNNNLTIQTFSPDAAKTHKGEAKNVVLRLTSTGGANPFPATAEIYCTYQTAGGRKTKQYIGKVLALNPSVPADLILEDPIFTPDFDPPGSFPVAAVEPSGHTTPDASLDASLILIPADPDEDPVTRERAVPLHEMRHVWQYAVLGPFFFSQPIPWLIDLGFQFKSDGAAHAAHAVTKWASFGGIDRAFSAIALGISGDGFSSTTVRGTISAAKRVDVDASVTADDLKHFEAGDPVEVGIGDNRVFNVVDTVSAGGFDLRFALETGFPVGAAVSVSVSPLERMNSKISKYFNLDIAASWGDSLPTSWGRMLRSFLNRESWFPFLGVYWLAFARAGFDQSRVYFEQDASVQSGDLYTSFGVSYPNEVFVGEYSRVIAFIEARGYGDVADGLSKLSGGLTSVLTVETPLPPAGKDAIDLVLGSASAGGNKVRFRKEFMLPMHEKIENAMGAMFVANKEGDYKVLALDQSLDDMVGPSKLLPPFIPFFPASFNELRIIKVKKLGLDKELTAAAPLFATESHTFVITGAQGVTYTIAYKATSPAPRGALNGLTFTAPAAAAANVTHQFEITATYPPGHDIFKARGKAHGAITLPPASLTNVCQDLDIVVAPIKVDPVTPGPVKAGAKAEFTASISPRVIGPPNNIPEAAVQARLTTDGKRLAKLTFFAPNKVNAATNVIIPLTFGTAPNDRTINLTVQVVP
jgi:YD repeat-containing protein